MIKPDFTLPQNIQMAEVERAVEDGEPMGYCLSCGEEIQDTSPATRAMPCDECGERMVFGVQEIAAMFEVR